MAISLGILTQHFQTYPGQFMVLWQSCRSDFKRIGFVQRSELCWTQTPQRKQCSSVVRAVKTVAFFCDWHAKGRVSKDMIFPNKVGSALSKIGISFALPPPLALEGANKQPWNLQNCTRRQSLSSISGSDITKPDLLQRCHRDLKQIYHPIQSIPGGIRQVNGKWSTNQPWSTCTMHVDLTNWLRPQLSFWPAGFGKVGSNLAEAAQEPIELANCHPEMYWLSEIQIWVCLKIG